MVAMMTAAAGAILQYAITGLRITGVGGGGKLILLVAIQVRS